MIVWKLLWKALGIESDEVLDDLVLLHPRIEDAQIVCDSSCRDWPGSNSRVSGLYLYLWKFRKLTDTRFAGMGPSFRVVAGALLAGTGVFVRALLAWCATRYYLGGFEQ